MNTLTFEAVKDFTSITLTPKFFFIQDTITETEINELNLATTITSKKINITPRERFIKFLRSRNILIQNEKAFYNLLNKLYQDEIQLIFEVVERLFNKNYSFHIEVYETDGDLEDLYFVIHYRGDVSDEYIEEDLFNLNEFVREIDKDKVLWFIGFASEIKDV